MSRQTGMRSPFAIVAMLGDRLRREATGWRDAKALILLVAQAGPPEEAWPCAADLADALGINDDFQERLYREAYGPHAPGERPGTCTPDTPCLRRRP